MDSNMLISVVCPFHNEGSNVSVFYDAMTTQFELMPDFLFELVCVDDGSNDDTLEQLIALSDIDARIRVIELSRNFGKEAALTAGLDEAQGDAVIPIDADLQDPPELIGSLLTAWQKNGVDVVLAKRIDRASDAILKRLSAAIFYELHNWVSQIKIPSNVGDCRLMTRVVVDALKQLPERQRFMKGLFAWVGFKTITIEYVRNRRFSGVSKFSGWRLWNFAVEGITSFSSLPLRIWTYVGMIGAFITLSYGIFIVLRTFILGVDVPGYASLLVSILFFGSLQLMGLGILGEYVGRIYVESKCRPSYLVRKIHRQQQLSTKS
jgi:glycosyltransferase involved in cell wall biosynthesis